jgi:hypothetical protein
MSELDQFIRENNPFYGGFVQMYEELEKAKETAIRDNIPFVEPKMYLVHRQDEARGRYNDPISIAEMAVVFTGPDGVPPPNPILRVYPRSTGRFQSLHGCDSSRDPMVYPLLFPYGELGKSDLKQSYNKFTNIFNLRTFLNERFPIKH